MVAVEAQERTETRVALNLDLCIECRSCAAACFYYQNQRPTLHFAHSGPGRLPAVCRQCAEAPCVEACPNEAMVRRNGANYRARFRCTGCGSCAAACPFGVLSFATFQGEIAKCDLCADRVDAGQLPRCVTSCPTGALQFVKSDEADALGLVLLGSRTLGQHPIRRR